MFNMFDNGNNCLIRWNGWLSWIPYLSEAPPVVTLFESHVNDTVLLKITDCGERDFERCADVCVEKVIGLT